MKYWKNNGQLIGVKPAIGGLYYLGEWMESWLENCVAVVGSRQMTTYGNRVVEMLIPQLVEEGKIIVSGGMYGVDKAAHEMTLKCGGKTVAVLGWGIAQELADFSLGKKIVEGGGLVVSEWADQKGGFVDVSAAKSDSGSDVQSCVCNRGGGKIWVVDNGRIGSQIGS